MVGDFLAGRGPMPGLEKKDLVQEVLTHWITQRQRYSGARGASIKTFFKKVARNCLEDIYRKQMAEKRGGKRIILSLDQPVDPEEKDDEVLSDTVADETDDVELKAVGEIEGDRILELLTPKERMLAGWLEQGYLLAEVARKMKVPRTTLNDELARIRRTLRNNGYGLNPTGDRP